MRKFIRITSKSKAYSENYPNCAKCFPVLNLWNALFFSSLRSNRTLNQSCENSFFLSDVGHGITRVCRSGPARKSGGL